MATKDKSTEKSDLLIRAIRGNNVDEVRALIDGGADVNITNNIGRTALFYAVRQSNNESVVHALIDGGADVKITDNLGQTALFYALKQFNNENVVRALIDGGADVNRTDYYGETGLFDAVKQSNNESVVHALIGGGADVNITNNIGQTALFDAVKQSNNESVVCALIDGGADVKITDNLGQTALFYAVKQFNNENVVHALIDGGADVKITDNNGQTALFYAVQQSNNKNVVRALIDGGAFLNVRDVYGRTPLFYALDSPIPNSVVFDGVRKSLFCLKDDFHCTILNFFVDRHLFVRYHKNIPQGFVELLDKCGIQKKSFAEAILNMVFCKFPLMFQETSKLGFLQYSGLSFDYISQTHISRALELASKFVDNQKEMKILIKLIYEKCKNGEQVSEALRLLVELGADPNSVDSLGNTVLHYATGLAWRGVPQGVVMEICLQLENSGVQLNLRNHENHTPLLFCLSGGMKQLKLPEENPSSAVKTMVEVCRLLLKHRSSIEEKSESGKTVIHLILQLFQQGLGVHNIRARQDVLLEALKLLQLFPPSKVVKQQSGIINTPDADLQSPIHVWASLALPSPQDYTSNVTKDLTFKQFLQTTLNYLLECGTILNAINLHDQTPLHLCRTFTAVKLLLDAGAKAKIVNLSEASPLVSAAQNRWSFSDFENGFYPDISQQEDPKSFWKTTINKGLDPWIADEGGSSVLSILIEQNEFGLAKALVDVACEQNYTQCETFAVSLLNVICKDESTRTNWKSILVQDILKSRKDPTNALEPLRLCCKNIVETGVLDNMVVLSSSVTEDEMSASEDMEIFDDGQPQSKKRRMDTSDQAIVAKFDNLSVHCELIKILRLNGADGNSCLDMASTSDALQELLTKPLDLSTVSELIPWTSISKKYKDKLTKAARRLECDVIHKEFWCHQEHVGSGSFGHVFVGINEKDGREVAVKRIEKLRMQRPEDKREIRNLTALADCEQIVRYLYFFEEDKFSYIVLELMEGNLDEYLTDGSIFDGRNSTQLCQDVVKGMKFLHEQNIIHRDLKPLNILYKTHPHLCLKIADFGLSRRINSNTTTVYGTNAGTRCWMAPEVLMGTLDHSKASDMFSCGLVLHYILSVQKHPFSKNNSQMPHEIETNMTNGRMEGWDKSLSPEATHLVKDMLQGVEKDRPTAEKALHHPFFWSNKEKVAFLIAVGNQVGSPSTGLAPVKTDLENKFSTIVVHGKWNDPRYNDMPYIYAEMTSRRNYDTKSVVDLVRCIRNAYAHVSEVIRPTKREMLLLERFIFLENFPRLVMEVYKVVKDHGWHQSVEEIKYAMNK